MKPSKDQTVLMRSKRPAVFANTAGREAYVTPQEATLLEMNGIAERVQPEQPPQKQYNHREMVTQRPSQQQSKKHK